MTQDIPLVSPKLSACPKRGQSPPFRPARANGDTQASTPRSRERKFAHFPHPLLNHGPARQPRTIQIGASIVECCCPLPLFRPFVVSPAPSVSVPEIHGPTSSAPEFFPSVSHRKTPVFPNRNEISHMFFTHPPGTLWPGPNPQIRVHWCSFAVSVPPSVSVRGIRGQTFPRSKSMVPKPRQTRMIRAHSSLVRVSFPHPKFVSIGVHLWFPNVPAGGADKKNRLTLWPLWLYESFRNGLLAQQPAARKRSASKQNGGWVVTANLHNTIFQTPLPDDGSGVFVLPKHPGNRSIGAQRRRAKIET